MLEESRHAESKGGALLLSSLIALGLLMAAASFRDRLFHDANWGFLISLLALSSLASVVMAGVCALRIINPLLSPNDKLRGRSGVTPMEAFNPSYLFPDDLRRIMAMVKPPTPENRRLEHSRLVDELKYRSSLAGEDRVCQDLAERIVEVGALVAQKGQFARLAAVYLYYGVLSGTAYVLLVAFVRSVGS